MASEILQLAELISSSAKTLVENAKKDNVPLPDLNDPFTMPSEAFRGNPESALAANIIVAATSQLAAAVGPPPLSVFRVLAGVDFYVTLCNHVRQADFDSSISDLPLFVFVWSSMLRRS